MTASDELFIRDPITAKKLLGLYSTCDPCFRSLAAYNLSKKRSLPPEEMARIARHEAECGGWCYRNVEIELEKTQDTFKKAVYRETLVDFFFGYSHQHGLSNDFRVTQEGVYFSVELPEQIKVFPSVMFSSIEMFMPVNPAVTPGYFEFRLKSKELYDNPRPFIQSLDATASRHAKAFPAESGRLHWRFISSEWGGQLRLRWKDQTKVVAPNTSLQGRYSKLLQKHDRKFQQDLSATGHGQQGPEAGQHALILEKVATEYQKQGWFMGFLKSYLYYSGKDLEDHARSDIISGAVPLDLDGASSPAGQQEQQWELERLKERLNRIRPELCLPERRCLDLFLEGLNDVEIAAKMKCRRETVNRYKRLIINKLQQLIAA